MARKTKEERLAAARAKVQKLDDATRTRGRADRMDWRPKALIWLHTDTDINERQRVWFACVVEDRDDKGKDKKKGKKKKTKVINLPFNVAADPAVDPFACMRKALKDRDDIEGDDLIFVVGTGRDKAQYSKGDILNWDDYDYKKSLRVASDFVCHAILAEDKKGNRPDKLKIETFAGAKTLGKEIRKEIESEVDENGDEQGNPFFRPYPFRISYDASASGTDMYSARARPAHETDDEIDALLEADIPDIKDELEIAKSKEIQDMLLEALIHPDFSWEVGKAEDADGSKDEAGDEVDDRADEGDGKDEDGDEGDAKDETDPEDDEAAAAEAEAEAAVAKAKAAKAKAAKAKKAKKDKAAKAKKEKAAEAEEPKTTSRKPRAKKVAVEEPADDVKVPDDYKDPGPRPDDKNVMWWPDREKGELYDLCPKCDRPVGLDDKKCPHTKDCGVDYAPSADPF